MKKISLLFLLISHSISAQRNKIFSFDILLDSLKSGNHVRDLIDYSRRKLIFDWRKDEAPKTIRGIDFKCFEFFDVISLFNPKAFISVSESVLIYPTRHGYILNYTKIRNYRTLS